MEPPENPGRFTDTVKKAAVWEEGIRVAGKNSDVWRKDYYGNLIRYGDYGDRNSKYGWEIDHIRPVRVDRSDALINVRPLQWEANVRRNN